MQQEKPYTVCNSQSHFYIQCLTKNQKFNPITSSLAKKKLTQYKNNYLRISRRTCRMEQIQFEQYNQKIKQSGFHQFKKFDLLLGIIIINCEPYLLIAIDCESVATYIEHPIYVIHQVEFIPFRNYSHKPNESLNEENKIIDKIKKDLFQDNFYFSYIEDITKGLGQQYSNFVPQQSQKSERQNLLNNHFVWNSFLLKPFLLKKLHKCWTIPIIQGYVNQISTGTNYFSFSYLTISRRSTHMSGTRFNSRGLDEEGHTSNFVQTEQIIKCHNNFYSHISLRGSVPLFWKQAHVRAEINYIKNKNVDEEYIVTKHYNDLKTEYNAIIMTINLLSKEKSPEKQLKNRFESIIYRSIKTPYLYFDLNQEMTDKVNGQNNISNFIELNKHKITHPTNFLIIEPITNKIFTTQTIVSRINCLDCLDRTNVIMARISQMFIQNVENYINQNVNMEEKKIKFTKQFYSQHIQLWAELGDKISLLYCGTESVSAHMTRKQNNSLISMLGGALTSLNRFINANITDLFKQQCIQFLLGTRGQLSSTDYFNHNICMYRLPEQFYCQFNLHKIFILTFDTNLINPKTFTNEQLSHLFRFDQSRHPEMIVVCLQEVSNYGYWMNVINEYFSELGYIQLIVYKLESGGLLSVIYVCKKHNISFSPNQKTELLRFRFIQVLEIKLKNIKFSKGALAIFVQINNSLICFINLHLISGYSKKQSRLEQFEEIHNYIYRQTYSNNIFKQCSFKFLIGNFNFRLNSHIKKQFKFKNVIEELSRNWYNEDIDNEDKIRQGLKYDEMTLLKSSSHWSYREGDIHYLPTYKYLSKKAGYDTSKVPSWCDRIIFSQRSKQQGQQTKNIYGSISCLIYDKVEENFGSTHKAVAGMYEIGVKTENQEMKNKLITQYLLN